jgi:predicted DsbA family dithiol-disulfide isomerase
VSVHITVYSDYICPFCYLGNEVMKQLEKDYCITAEWRGFIIHKQGKESPYLEEGYVNRKWNILRQLAQEMGKTVSKPSFVPDTALALEGGEYAKDQGLFQAFHDGVFSAYFERGMDIGDRDVLTGIAGDAGLDPSDFWKNIESGEMGERIEAHRKEANENFITAFPTFLFDGITPQHFRIVGAHPYPTMKLHLENYLKRRDRILGNLN